MNFKSALNICIPISFAAVVGANILSMSLMNLFEIETRYTTFLYFMCAALVVILFVKTGVKFPALERNEHILCIALAVVLFIPRLAYVFESSLGYVVNTVGDDSLHLQEMVSIIKTPRFPPRSTFDASKYLSYYYAPWMLGAAFYWTGLLSTVKQALAVQSLIYGAFATYSIVYASKMLFFEARLQRTFLIICILYGGFDFIYWLLNFSYIPVHSEGWAEDLGFVLEYSNFFTLALWVPQHLIAAIAVCFSLYVIASSNATSAAALCGLFLLSALFSSVFVVLGAAPFIAWFFLRHRLFRSIPVAAATFFVFLVPLWWIFLGRTTTTGFRLFGELFAFWQSNKRAAFLVFLLILSLELMPLMAAALASVRRRPNLLWPFALSVLFLSSTYLVSFGIGPNYSMRGAIIPTFVLSYLAVPALCEWWSKPSSRWLLVVLPAYFLGGVLEYAWFVTDSLTSLSKSNTELNAVVLELNQEKSAVSVATINERFGASDRALAWYLLEGKGWPKERSAEYDPFDAEITNVDVGYRITAVRVARWLRSLGESLRK